MTATFIPFDAGGGRWGADHRAKIGARSVQIASHVLQWSWAGKGLHPTHGFAEGELL